MASRVLTCSKRQGLAKVKGAQAAEDWDSLPFLSLKHGGLCWLSRWARVS